MNGVQISYFLQAAKSLSFTQVAEKFYTTQPTVSRQIAALETELGFPLFERDNNVLRLTKGGAVMALELRKIRDEVNNAIGRAKLADESVPQKLAIGYVSNLRVEKYLYPLLSAFSETYPNVDIQITGNSFSELRCKLAENEYDVIVTYNFELPGMRNIQYEKICSVNSGFLFSGKHPLAKKRVLSFRDFDNATFYVLQEEESAGRDTELYVITSVLGLKNIQIRHCENVDSLLYQVSLGRGVTIVSDALEISHNPQFRHYQYPNVGTLPFLACVWKSDSTNPAVPQFMQNIRSVSKSIHV